MMQESQMPAISLGPTVLPALSAWGMPLNLEQVTFVPDDEPEPELEPDAEDTEIQQTVHKTRRVDHSDDDDFQEPDFANNGEGGAPQQRRLVRTTAQRSANMAALAASRLNSNMNMKHLVREKKQPYNENGERVYCICRGPDNGKFMISCDVCKDWYHGSCVNITERMGQSIKFYECPYCIQAKNDALGNQIGVSGAISVERVEEGDEQTSTITRPHVSTIATTATISRRNNSALLPKRGSITSTTSSTAKHDSPTPTSTSAPEPDVGPTSMAWIHDKTRSLVRKSFGDLIRTIHEDLKVEGIHPLPPPAERETTELPKEGAWLDVTELAGSMEDELFDFTADGEKGSKRYCGDKYKAKFRSLQFNLKDKKNSTLRTRLIQGLLPTSSLVRLEPKDLANDEIKAKSEEIRILNLHNAIKPKDFADVVYKKTHKGDEEVRQVSDEREEEDKIVKRRRAAAAAVREEEEDGDGMVDVKEEKRSSPPPVSQLFPKEIARIVAEAEAAARAPIKITAPTKIETLDDLLAKMDGGDSPSLKRRGSDSELYGADSAKKGRVDEETTVVAGNGWDNLAVTDSWGSFEGGMDGDDSWMRDDDFGVGSSSSVAASGNGYSPHSPKETPPPEEAPAVWSGMVRMPQVAKFTGHCRQIAGRPVGSAIKCWEALLPPSVMVEGRIDIRAAQKYIDQQKLSTSKEVIAIEFSPDETELLNDYNSNVTPNAEGGFQQLLDYFLDKSRYAVVGGKYVSVRDMYLVPVRAGDTVPQTITVLSKFNVSDKTDTNRLFGVMVLDKAFFTSAANALSSSETAKRPSPTSGTSNARAPVPNSYSSVPSATTAPLRKEPVRDPRMRSMPPPPLAPIVPTAIPTTIATVPAPWAGLSTFAQTQQQHAPALPLGTLPPAPSATALALLMQLQRQQQQAQAAAPVVPQGIAGLLSQIQAAQQQQQNQQQQQQQQQSYSSSASLYGYQSGGSRCANGVEAAKHSVEEAIEAVTGYHFQTEEEAAAAIAALELKVTKVTVIRPVLNNGFQEGSIKHLVQSKLTNDNDPKLIDSDTATETVMSGFSPEKIPIFATLAEEFGMACRVFLASSTSNGMSHNDNVAFAEGLPQTSIFKMFHDKGGLKFKNLWSSSNWFNDIRKIVEEDLLELEPYGHIENMARFKKDAAEGTLPSFSWIDPCFMTLSYLLLPDSSRTMRRNLIMGL
ncbi:UNVERIFIED_CONTAM: PHD finger protein 3 [Siphonaria sp. JEL0065]|nr:PHD finger protein 3 [Siphonaria sp. JEL0065]